jgi:predicted PurR-regulated permease PerM
MKPSPINGDPERVETVRRLQSEKLSRYFLVGLLIVTVIIFFNMVKMFTSPLLLAGVFSTLFYPLYQKLYRVVRHPGFSAFVCCVIVLICLLVPLYFVGNVVAYQTRSFFQTAQQRVGPVLEQQRNGDPLAQVRNWIIRSLNLDRTDWDRLVRNAASSAGGLIASVIKRTSGGAFYFIANIFITLFIMFYFFRDGQKLINRIRFLIPLRDVYLDAMMTRFVSVSRATIKGTVLIGLAQSTLGAITLWIFGVSSPLLWWVVMSICAMIPVIGAWVVMYPAGIIQILLGQVWQGVAILLITAFVISLIDNIFRPRLVGQSTGMHDLVVFFAALGGLRTFGPVGVIVGPVIAAFFVTVLDIYSAEFRHQLQRTAPEPDTENNALKTL